ncbi:YjbQ family protein [Actinopolymorpha cephalotaxi]|nr:YjbQ family protein [Actinopolymorpha cephalotaxi]NYH83141.1 secondary thiamine-phosphate synthase enzyme [Actinopolymorpha cephalotaxi]
MRSEIVEVRTGSDEVVYDLTDECERFLATAFEGAERGDGGGDGGDGILHVFVPHATAGVAVIETGSGSDDDLLAVLGAVLPPDFGWRHRHGSPGHGRDHVVPAFVPPYATLPVVAGRLALGTWQRVCLVDTNRDNPRRKVRLSLLRG